MNQPYSVFDSSILIIDQLVAIIVRSGLSPGHPPKPHTLTSHPPPELPACLVSCVYQTELMFSRRKREFLIAIFLFLPPTWTRSKSWIGKRLSKRKSYFFQLYQTFGSRMLCSILQTTFFETNRFFNERKRTNTLNFFLLYFELESEARMILTIQFLNSFFSTSQQKLRKKKFCEAR